MNPRLVPQRTLLSMLVLSATILRAQAQSPSKTTPSDELSRTIGSLDSALFDAYNECDLEKFATFFTDDVEFYHDQGGVTLGRQNLTNPCRKTSAAKYVASRSGNPRGVSHAWLLAPSRWVCIVSTSPRWIQTSRLGRQNLFTSGKTRMASGRSPA